MTRLRRSSIVVLEICDAAPGPAESLGSVKSNCLNKQGDLPKKDRGWGQQTHLVSLYI